MDDEQTPEEPMQADASIDLHPPADQASQQPAPVLPTEPRVVSPTTTPDPSAPPAAPQPAGQPAQKVQWCPSCRVAISIPAAGNTCPACNTPLVPLPPEFSAEG